MILKSKLNGRNKITALNTWAVSILRYGAGILKWNKNELQETDRKTRKLKTINNELHPQSDIARLHVSRKNGGRGLIGCENRVKSEENSLGWYLKNNLEPLLAAVRTSRITTHEETIDPKELKKIKERQRKMNGMQKECMDNLLETWRTRIRTTHGDG